MSEYLEYYVGFSHFLGIGPYRFSILLNHYGSVKQAYMAPLKEMKELIGDKTAQKFVNFRNVFDSQQKIKEIEAKQIEIIAQNSHYFPAPLLHIPDIPICLYVKGNIRTYDFNTGIYIGIS